MDEEIEVTKVSELDAIEVMDELPGFYALGTKAATSKRANLGLVKTAMDNAETAAATATLKAAAAAQSAAVAAQHVETKSSLVDGEGVAQVEAKSDSVEINMPIVGDTAFDNLKVGGVNLLQRGDETKGVVVSSNGSIVTYYGNCAVGNYVIPCVTGNSFMFSKSGAENVNYWRCKWVDANGLFISYFTSGKNKFKAVAPTNATGLIVSYYTDVFPMLEKGNKASESWSPNYNDYPNSREYLDPISSITIKTGNTPVVYSTQGDDTFTLSGVSGSASFFSLHKDGGAFDNSQYDVIINQICDGSSIYNIIYNNVSGYFEFLETIISNSSMSTSNLDEITTYFTLRIYKRKLA